MSDNPSPLDQSAIEANQCDFDDYDLFLQSLKGRYDRSRAEGSDIERQKQEIDQRHENNLKDTNKIGALIAHVEKTKTCIDRETPSSSRLQVCSLQSPSLLDTCLGK